MASAEIGEQTTENDMQKEHEAALEKIMQRQKFLLKTFSQLTIQVMICAIVVFSLQCSPMLQTFISEHMQAFAIFVMLSMFALCITMRWSKRVCLYLLKLFTIGVFNVGISMIIGYYTVFTKPRIIVILIGIAIAVPAYLAVYDFKNSIQLCIIVETVRFALLVLMISMTMGIVQLSNASLLKIAYIAAIVFAFYFFHDTQMMVADFENGYIGPDDHLSVMLSLFLDIINLLIYVFTTLGLSYKYDDMEPLSYMLTP